MPKEIAGWGRLETIILTIPCHCCNSKDL